MIEDKNLSWMTVDEANRFLELMFDDEQIVYKASLVEGADATVEVWAIEEALRLGLHNVAQADQVFVGGEGVQCGFEIC